MLLRLLLLGNHSTASCMYVSIFHFALSDFISSSEHSASPSLKSVRAECKGTESVLN